MEKHFCNTTGIEVAVNPEELAFFCVQFKTAPLFMESFGSENHVTAVSINSVKCLVRCFAAYRQN